MVRVLVNCLLYSVLALSLNMFSGICGQISLGHIGFFCIGAYTSALMSLRLNAPFGLCFLSAGVLAAIAAILIGIPGLKAVRRLSGHHYDQFFRDHSSCDRELGQLLHAGRWVCPVFRRFRYSVGVFPAISPTIFYAGILHHRRDPHEAHNQQLFWPRPAGHS